ncbi:MAG: SUMF1/EgtB/PvdO family nonheme iron enzyme, partial [Pirellulales bacterium]|nr:SUMF1/EgtB/PvdO family nonheme iron enzyme [Pirellulales bacterium]
KPIIESACLRCHDEQNAEGDLRLDSLKGAIAGGANGPSIVPNDLEKSTFYSRLVLPEDHLEVMPPDGPPLDEAQVARLRTWIAEGAKWPADAKLEVQPRIDFFEHVQPILEVHCVSCHSGDEPEGAFDLTTLQAALESGSTPPSIVPFKPEESSLYTLTIVEKDDPTLMPPAAQGGPLGNDAIEMLRLWIAQGAIWPEGVSLKTRPNPASSVPSPDDMQLVRKIHALIMEISKDDGGAESTHYSAKVPQTGAPYHMVALQGGEFLMGSPSTEARRQENEGPQTNVKVSPFWIGKYEVTWDEYEPYMINQIDRLKNGARKDFDPLQHGVVDAVSQPTAPYVEMSFGMGQQGYPAISMTEHAANKYCQWLSAQTGHFYRLPTEAEWEYACRAGTNTAYSFGDDPAKLGDYAWYYDNSDEKYQQVGKKRPNPWGLYDMHGNVMEWTADQFVPDYFTRLGPHPDNPFVRPQTIYPRTVRGGGWDDDPEQLRSAFRRGSEATWKLQDPQLPKSIWYFTDAQWLGFRIVRPKDVPSVEEMYFYWNSATNKH